MDEQLLNAAQKVVHVLKDRDLTLASAESCTAGMVGMALCAASEGGVPYASGFITYDDRAKNQLLHVSTDTLAKFTAVSAQTVKEMAKGASEMAGTDTGLSVSGYAGPEGGEDGTPAGTVWFGWYLGPGKQRQEVRHFDGDSEAVLLQASIFALEKLAALL
ncbi:CinA family protein [Rahnella perminowiae]|uniref:CinA family protein n=2 Tax=Rahnella perminowiae TaxID=2816244 RepID=A0ABS6KYY3_9GAMM|nr:MULTISPECIES: CinA family protein [Rahnella]UJD92463.1 CinA family protein [Rahnella aquatilis]MBU9808474.1 CinA family protein [Rahnella perminowiae]MBU9824223.1 CinA family protein [Rahnella perminowiae]MBU9834686.1 CinA family protein [Rahnella perminowiae]MCR9003153.1 CinA family protein [Rahnella perminowiae]